MFGILVLGDSITFGRGESPTYGWSGRLKEYFEAQEFHNCLYNLGLPGDTSTNLLKRFETEIKSRARYVRPGDKYLILIGIGINDSRGIDTPNNLETSPEKYKMNVEKLVKIAKKYTKDVVLLELTPVDESITNPFEDTYFTNSRIQEFNSILKDVSQKENILFLELFNEIYSTNYKEKLVDGVHPNSSGYELMFKIIKEYLLEKKLIN